MQQAQEVQQVHQAQPDTLDGVEQWALQDPERISYRLQRFWHTVVTMDLATNFTVLPTLDQGCGSIQRRQRRWSFQPQFTVQLAAPPFPL